MQTPSIQGPPTPMPSLPLQPARQFSASQETAFVPTTDGFGSVQGDHMQSSDFGGTDGDSLDWDAPWQGHPKPRLELPGGWAGPPLHGRVLLGRVCLCSVAACLAAVC